MNLKMVLIVLLCASSVSANESANRIEESTKRLELTKTLVIKLEQLTDLGNKITEQEALIALIEKKINDLSLAYINAKVAAANIKNNEEKKMGLRSQVSKELARERSDLELAYHTKMFMKHSDAKNLLFEEFMKNLQEDECFDTALIKFYCIRRLYEKMRLITLISVWVLGTNKINEINVQIQSTL